MVRFPLAIGGYIPHTLSMAHQIAPHMAALLSEIEAAKSQAGLSDRDIGMLTMKDHKLVADIRDGRELRHVSREKVRKGLSELLSRDTAA